MSMICHYVRTSEDRLPALSRRPETIVEGGTSRVEGVEAIDIDRAHEALAWLASPLKRAEQAHNTRLIFDSAWPDDDARASVARLRAMPLDDALAAIEGRSSERLEAIDFGLGGAACFPPDRVRELSAALSALTEEALRARLDFAAMDEQDVVPGYWAEEGEDTFQTYLLPALRRLQDFYAAAAAAGEVVLVVWM